MNEEKYKTLLEQYSKNVIASNTDLSGKITYVSDAFCTISGYSQEELLGSNHNIVRHSDMPKELFEKLWKTIQNDEVFVGEIKNRRKDGSFYWVEVTVSSLYENGKKIGYSAIRHDITQKKECEKLNQEHNKLLAQFSKYVIASKTDLKGTITYVSDAFCEISGYSKEELIGHNHNIVRHPDMPDALFKDLWQTISSQKVFFGEFKNRTKNNDYYWVEVAISPEYNEKAEHVGYSAIRHNITQKKIIEELMIIDPLTKIKNRQFYDKSMDEKIELFNRYGTHFSLILLDIDYFKNINDSYGHDIGDSVLIELSRLIETSIRKCDLFCRIGGEEFVILFSNNTDEDAVAFAHKLQTIISEHNFHSVNKVTISLGVASCSKGDTKSTLFKKADNALYKSKESGRNCVTVWSE